MEIVAKLLEDIYVLRPERHMDERGYFCETFAERSLAQAGIAFHCVQDNEAMSLRKGTLRGLHYQKPPFGQAMLMRCTRGDILAAAVDVRQGSPSFGKAAVYELRAEDGIAIYIPQGYARGTISLCDDCVYDYKVDAPYNGDPAFNGGLSFFFDREKLDPSALLGQDTFIMSERDRRKLAGRIEELDWDFIYGK